MGRWPRLCSTRLRDCVGAETAAENDEREIAIWKRGVTL
jgi:hypothetical protein